MQTWTYSQPAPRDFLEEEMEVMARDAVVFAHVALGLVPEVLDSVDVPARAEHKGFAVIDAMVMEAGDIEDVIGSERI
jgi:hypothetical protein